MLTHRQSGRALVIDDRCTACGQCLSTCPEHALSRAPFRPAINVSACTFCSACIEICPTDAIAIVTATTTATSDHPTGATNPKNQTNEIDVIWMGAFV